MVVSFLLATAVCKATPFCVLVKAVLCWNGPTLIL